MKIKEEEFINEIVRLSKLDNPGVDIIGLALLNLGVQHNDFGNLRTKDALHSYFGFSRKTSHWADTVQYYQDIGYPWDKCVYEANLKVLKNDLTRH